MRIIHVLTGFPIEYPGGITNYVRSLAKAQLSRGYAVGIVTPSSTLPEQLGGASLLQVENVRYRNYSHGLAKRSAGDPCLTKIVEFNPDIVHFHCVLGVSAGFMGAMRDCGIPYVISVHDYYLACPRIFMIDKWGAPCRSVDPGKCASCSGLLEHVNLLRIGFKRLGVRLPTIASAKAEQRRKKIEHFVDGASGLIAVSQRTANIIKNAYPKSTCVVRHIGSASAELRPLPKTESNRIRACFIGTLSKHKGGDIFVELLEFLSKERSCALEVHFYGKMEEAYEQKLKALPVVLHGKYVPSDIPKIMSKTDIGLVLPIWEDNGPQVVMEMLNLEVPVFATKVGGIPDFVNERNGFLFEPDSIEERKNAYQWLISLTKKQLAVLKPCSRLATVDRHCEQLDTDYREVIRH